MSESSKKWIFGVAGATLLGGAVAYYFYSQASSSKEDDDVAFSHKTAAKPKGMIPTDSQNGSASDFGMQPSESLVMDPDMNQFTSQYSFQANPENEGKMQEQMGADPLPHHAGAFMQDGAINYTRLGLYLPLPAGWISHEEVPPIPSLSMITVTKPEFLRMMEEMQNPADSARIPLVVLTVEEVAHEGLDNMEYKEKAKTMAISRMIMASGGMFKPEIAFDGEMHVGPFRACLEYMQATHQGRTHILSLMTVEEGLAYVLQFACEPTVFAKYKDDVMNIARNIKITPKPLPISFCMQSFLDVCQNGIKVKCPSVWRLVESSVALIQFQTPSMTKTETVSIYRNDSDTVVSMLASSTEVSEVKLDNNIVFTTLRCNDTHRERKLFTNGKFALIVQPLKSKCVVPDNYLAELLGYVQEVDGAGQSMKYVSPARYFQFQSNPKATIVESRVGDGAILYSPDGINPEQPNMEACGLTIRCEDPTTDPDCMSTLDAWFDRIQTDKAKSGSGEALTELKKEMVANNEAISFVTKEMAEVGPGMRDERTAKIIIFCIDSRTTFLRWEGSTGEFRKTERKFTQLMNSWKFL